MLPTTFSFVDIETTGMRLSRDRIIEIGILRIEKNRVVRKYQTLINPQTYISHVIEELTGITKQELDQAPPFERVKDEILELLQGSVFVAHNARFDYGFIKTELQRLGISFRQKHFCTVRLSRYLYPQHRNHSLDHLIERFNIPCKQRHRAFDDAKVMYAFFKIAKKQFPKEHFEQALSRALKKPAMPLGLSSKDLDSLPELPGAYIFYGKDGMPLYIGKSVNIRDRVLSHFASDHASSLELKIAQQVTRIETRVTAGELGALFTENALIKKLQPLYNRKLRIKRKLTVLKTKVDTKGYQTVSFDTYEYINAEEIEDIIGIFPSKKRAKDFLLNIAKTHSLCEKILGIENMTTACFSYRLGTCYGACIGEENPMKYNMRFIMAFSKNKIKPWPFKGPIVIEGTLFFDKWCFVGRKTHADGMEEVRENMEERVFDVDTYKILQGYLRSPKHVQKVKQLYS